MSSYFKAEISDWYTNVYPTNEQAKEVCGLGTGADTCIWLMMSSKGWECGVYHKNFELLRRFDAGATNAKRNGCDGEGCGPPVEGLNV